MNKNLLSDIKLFLKKIPKFFTTWIVIIFIITNIFEKHIPYYILLSSQNFILTTSTFGFYILHKYGHNLLKKFNSIKLFHIEIFNFLFHVFPLLYIFEIKNKILITRNNDDLIRSFIFSCVIIFLYLFLYNPTNVYWFTRYNKKKLITISIVIYISLFFINIL